MRVQTKHSLEELKKRAELALNDLDLIEIAITHQSPNSAQKTAVIFACGVKVYSTWALAAIKRDYPEEFEYGVWETIHS